MKMEAYLQEVMDQIRCDKAKGPVGEELKQHILDQAEAYEAQGFHKDVSLEKAVADMGDPVETGVALDKVHRPKMSWELLFLIGLLGITGIALMYMLNQNGIETDWYSQAIYTVVGFAAMLLIYRLDYSILGSNGRVLAGTYLLLMIIGSTFFGVTMNGASRWIGIFSLRLSIPELYLLYLPLYGAVLYSYRGEDKRVLKKLLLWMLVPMIFIKNASNIQGMLLLAAGLWAMTALAVWKGWYHVSKKLTLSLMAAVSVAVPLGVIGYICCGSGYRSERLRMLLSGDLTNDYLVTATREIRDHSALLGGSESGIRRISETVPEMFVSDYTLVGIGSVFGIAAVAVLLLLLIALVAKIFHISFSQKNQLGMMVGCGCGIVFFWKIFVSCLVNFQLIPSVAATLPLVSANGTSIVVTYIMLGLVLSIYRYKSILPLNS